MAAVSSEISKKNSSGSINNGRWFKVEGKQFAFFSVGSLFRLTESCQRKFVFMNISKEDKAWLETILRKSENESWWTDSSIRTPGGRLFAKDCGNIEGRFLCIQKWERMRIHTVCIPFGHGGHGWRNLVKLFTYRSNQLDKIEKNKSSTEEEKRTRWPEEAVVVARIHNSKLARGSECNMYSLTLDGVDIMGERLAEEVLDVVNRTPEIQKISFVAHSVGGLVARYAIGRMYRPIRIPKAGVACDDSIGTICGLEPMNFITVATPHLGSRGNNQVPFLFGVTAVERVASLVAHWIFRRTGRHLFLTDDDGGQPPLLQRMVDDSGDLYFMSALRAFKRRVTYANVGNDHIVGWRTSSIRRNSELPKWESSLNDKYPHIVYEDHSKGASTDEGMGNSEMNDAFEIIEEKMVTSLSRLSWERVDVSFHRSRQRFAAHSIIQVKFPFMESDGADVIRHMIDHFLT